MQDNFNDQICDKHSLDERYEFKRSGSIGTDFLADIVKIKRTTNSSVPQHLDEYLALYKANSESYILVYHDYEVVGYACFFPITNNLSNKIENAEVVNRYDIKADDVISYPESKVQETEDIKRGNGLSIFLYSIVMLTNHRSHRVGAGLLKEIFDFLTKKTQEGCHIEKIYSFADSNYARSWLVGIAGFSNKDENGSKTGRLEYTFDSFDETNMFLYIPFYIDTKYKEIHKKIDKLQEPEHESVKKYFNGLTEALKYEIRSEISEKIERRYLGKEELIIKNEYKYVEYEDRKCHICLYYYKCFYIAVLYIENLGMDPTVLLSQVSLGYKQIKIKYGNKDINIGLYIREKIKIRKNESDGRIKSGGDIHCVTSLIKKPAVTHLAFMMACENIPVSKYIKLPTPLTGPEFFNKACTNLAQYGLGQVYASGKNVVYIFDKINKDRKETEILLLLVMELLMLQYCSIYSVNFEIMLALDKGEFFTATINSVNRRYSCAAMLWDFDNYSYLTSKQIHGLIAEEFGIPRLRDEYKNNFNIFEKTATSRAQNIIQWLVVSLTALAGVSAVKPIMEVILFNMPASARDSLIRWIEIALIVFVGLFFLFIKFRKSVRKAFSDIKKLTFKLLNLSN